MAYIKPTNSKSGIYTGSVSDRISPPRYTGKETDTMEIIVDNERAVIEGNVKWKSFLGETSDKAFPGDKGLEHHQQIINLMKSLNAEIKRATSMDDALSALISNSNASTNVAIEAIRKDLQALATNFSSYVESLSDIEQSLRDELNTLESSLESQITSERDSRVDADNILSEQIGDLSLKECNDTQRLAARIDAVESRVTITEDSLSDVGELVDDAINSTSNELLDKITDEADIRKRTDDNLASLIDTATHSIEKAIGDIAVVSASMRALESSFTKKTDTMSSTLMGIISDEISERKRIDESTSLLIDNLSDRVDNVVESVDDYVADTSATMRSLEAHVTATDNKISRNIYDLDNKVDNLLLEVEENLSDIDKKIDGAVSPLNANLIEVEDKVNRESTRSQNEDASLRVVTESLQVQINDAVKKGEDELAYVWNATTEWIKEVEASIEDNKEIIDSIDLIDGGNAPVLH